MAISFLHRNSKTGPPALLKLTTVAVTEGGKPLAFGEYYYYKKLKYTVLKSCCLVHYVATKIGPLRIWLVNCSVNSTGSVGLL